MCLLLRNEMLHFTRVCSIVNSLSLSVLTLHLEMSKRLLVHFALPFLIWTNALFESCNKDECALEQSHVIWHSDNNLWFQPQEREAQFQSDEIQLKVVFLFFLPLLFSSQWAEKRGRNEAQGEIVTCFQDFHYIKRPSLSSDERSNLPTSVIITSSLCSSRNPERLGETNVISPFSVVIICHLVIKAWHSRSHLFTTECV